jgi:hypothetical protein
MMPSISRLYNVNDRLINEYRVVGGLEIDRGIHSTQVKPTPIHHKSLMT